MIYKTTHQQLFKVGEHPFEMYDLEKVKTLDPIPPDTAHHWTILYIKEDKIFLGGTIIVWQTDN
jgi:hypothetical protein